MEPFSNPGSIVVHYCYAVPIYHNVLGCRFNNTRLRVGDFVTFSANYGAWEGLNVPRIIAEGKIVEVIDGTEYRIKIPAVTKNAKQVAEIINSFPYCYVTLFK